MNENLLDDYIKAETIVDLMGKTIRCLLVERLTIQYPKFDEKCLEKFNVNKDNISVWITDHGLCGEWFFFDYDYIYMEMNDFLKLELKYPRFHFDDYSTSYYEDDEDDLF